MVASSINKKASNKFENQILSSRTDVQNRIHIIKDIYQLWILNNMYSIEIFLQSMKDIQIL